MGGICGSGSFTESVDGQGHKKEKCQLSAF